VSARYETVFLDRDGVLNRKADEGDYVKAVEEWRWLPGAVEALQELQRAGSRLVVVTNQRGVARGLMTAEALEAIHARLGDDLRAAGVTLAGIYACPHHADACDCRKPGTGLFEQAARELRGIDPATSAMVGDSLSDLEAGTRFGCATYLVAGHDSPLPARAAARGLRLDGVAASLREVVADHLLPARVAGPAS